MGSYTRKNMLTGENETKRMKGMLVYFLQKKFEYKEIEISNIEESGDMKLTAQLDHYIIDHYDSKDNPVFAFGKCGDHILDALMLANFAFIENYDSILSFKDLIKISPKQTESNINDFNNFVLSKKEPMMSSTKTNFMNIYSENNFEKKDDEVTEVAKINKHNGSMFNKNKGFIKRRGIF